tara:strand:- start:995 stop:1339 length:345 start_codon:yes stop_codon:yes gene_type:complete
MEFFCYLIAAYGITFGMQNKALFLRDKHSFLDAMLHCTYCTGFHAGWLTWLIWKIDSVINGSVWGFELLGMLLFAMASSGFSYFIDTAVRLMETYADPVLLEDEDSEDDYEDDL